jgi:putative ABC transport system ATP-binding protein
MGGVDRRVILAARQVVKDYRQGDGVQRVLDHLTVEVPAGRFVAIMGPSGSGKSTLLHLLGGLDTPDAGVVELDGEPLSTLSDDERTRLRRNRIGIVYQFFNLVPVLTVAENVALPAVIAGRPAVTYRSTLDDVIELVGLGAHRDKVPSQLSGGQQQRAAIARALFTSPAVLLADEPTGNLDRTSGAEVLGLFLAAQRAMGQTIVMVTHDPRAAAHAHDVHLLRDGALGDELDVASRCQEAARLDPTHEERSRVVLRWLEVREATAAAQAARRHVAARDT